MVVEIYYLPAILHALSHLILTTTLQVNTIILKDLELGNEVQ